MDIRLGSSAHDLHVTLIPGSAWISAGLKSTAGPWAVGTVWSLVFTHDDTVIATWIADINDDIASWVATAAEVATVLSAPAVRNVALWYSGTAAEPIIFARGVVQVDA